jgi:hypothetical protein
MIFPSVPCKIISLSTDIDDYGQLVFSSPIDALCSVVKLSVSSQKTSIRTDSSGSRGHAKEIQAAARLLFKPFVKLKPDDRVEINGIYLRVIEINTRYQTFFSIPDHLQVDLDIWV